MLEERIKHVSRLIGCTPSSILHISDWKQTVTFVGIIEGDRLITVKACDTLSNDTIKKKLKTEIEFYSKNKPTFAPRCITSGDGYLALDYIDGATLRKWLVDILTVNRKNNCDAEVRRIFYQSIKTIRRFVELEPLHSGPLKTATSNALKATLQERLKDLLLSGPRNTQKSVVENVISKVFYINFRPLINHLFHQLVNRWMSSELNLFSKYGHNDLHCNNLLVPAGEVNLIDYENVCQPGIWISDVLYFGATLYAALSGKDRLQNWISEEVKDLIVSLEPKLAENSRKILNVFLTAGETNSRFRILNKHTNLKSFFRFGSALLYK